MLKIGILIKIIKDEIVLLNFILPQQTLPTYMTDVNLTRPLLCFHYMELSLQKTFNR